MIGSPVRGFREVTRRNPVYSATIFRVALAQAEGIDTNLTNRAFSELAGLQRSSLHKHLKRLTGEGYLEAYSPGGQLVLYRLNVAKIIEEWVAWVRQLAETRSSSAQADQIATYRPVIDMLRDHEKEIKNMKLLSQLIFSYFAHVGRFLPDDPDDTESPTVELALVHLTDDLAERLHLPKSEERKKRPVFEYVHRIGESPLHISFDCPKEEAIFFGSLIQIIRSMNWKVTSPVHSGLLNALRDHRNT